MRPVSPLFHELPFPFSLAAQEKSLPHRVFCPYRPFQGVRQVSYLYKGYKKILFTLSSLSFHFFFLGEFSWHDFASLEMQVQAFDLVRIEGLRRIILFNIYNRLIIHTILPFQASGNE